MITGTLLAMLALAIPWLTEIFYLTAPTTLYLCLAMGVGFASGGWHWPLVRLGALGRRA